LAQLEAGCAEGTCHCNQGWFYTYVVDVLDDRARAINVIPLQEHYCETAKLAFDEHARAGTFTVERTSQVTFRTRDTSPGDNAGGMTLEVVRSDLMPLSLEGLVAHWSFDSTWEAHAPTACPLLGHGEGPGRAVALEGRVDELYVFSRALSDTEVEALFHL
jgi:hypothetical protein